MLLIYVTLNVNICQIDCPSPWWRSISVFNPAQKGIYDLITKWKIYKILRKDSYFCQVVDFCVTSLGAEQKKLEFCHQKTVSVLIWGVLIMILWEVSKVPIPLGIMPSLIRNLLPHPSSPRYCSILLKVIFSHFFLEEWRKKILMLLGTKVLKKLS